MCLDLSVVSDAALDSDDRFTCSCHWGYELLPNDGALQMNFVGLNLFVVYGPSLQSVSASLGSFYSPDHLEAVITASVPGAGRDIRCRRLSSQSRLLGRNCVDDCQHFTTEFDGVECRICSRVAAAGLRRERSAVCLSTGVHTRCHLFPCPQRRTYLPYSPCLSQLMTRLSCARRGWWKYLCLFGRLSLNSLMIDAFVSS